MPYSLYICSLFRSILDYNSYEYMNNKDGELICYKNP